MLTKDQLRNLLEELPDREPRSSLDPYRELVIEMRRRQYSYREIARFMAKRCGLGISHNAVRNFVNRHCPEIVDTVAPESYGQCVSSPTTPPTKLREGRESEQPQAVRDRIDALKRRPQLGATDGTSFQFDPAQPLRLLDEEA